MDNEDTLAGLQAENDALRKTIEERSKELFDALSALSGMWYQYCPPPWTHMFMNAGEEAEEILKRWDLLRPDETSIQISGMQIDNDMPPKILNLLGIPSQQ